MAPINIFRPATCSVARISRRCLSTTPTRFNEKGLLEKEEEAPVFSEDPDVDLRELNAVEKSFGDSEIRDRVRRLLREFRAPVQYAMAYGSGVFSQGKGTSSKPMIDLILGVSHTQHWHSLNLRQHRSHYSFLGSLGSGAVSYVQDNLGAGVYFNPYVDIQGTMVKYGVVNIDTLCRDLSEWDTLYLAGRLHKPCMILREPQQVSHSHRSNLLAAVRVALLLLPESFTERQLYMTIAGISYLGDPRMSTFTENPHKVANIVDNNLTNFRLLYSHIIEQLPNLTFRHQNGWDAEPADTHLVQDMDPIRRGNMVCRLPKAFREHLYFQYQRKFQIPNLEFRKMVGLDEEAEMRHKKKGGEFEQRIGADVDNIRKEVATVIKRTVKWPSTTQSLKGVLTAGPVKSLQYLGEKMAKFRKSAK